MKLFTGERETGKRELKRLGEHLFGYPSEKDIFYIIFLISYMT